MTKGQQPKQIKASATSEALKMQHGKATVKSLELIGTPENRAFETFTV